MTYAGTRIGHAERRRDAEWRKEKVATGGTQLLIKLYGKGAVAFCQGTQ